MAKPKSVHVPIVRIKKGDSRKTIYAKVRKAFTAEDLARYCQVESEGLSADQMLAQLKAIEREERLKLKKKSKRA